MRHRIEKEQAGEHSALFLFNAMLWHESLEQAPGRESPSPAGDAPVLWHCQIRESGRENLPTPSTPPDPFQKIYRILLFSILFLIL